MQQRLPHQNTLAIFRRDRKTAIERSRRQPRYMRSGNNVRQGEERVREIRRFVRKNIETGCGEFA